MRALLLALPFVLFACAPADGLDEDNIAAGDDKADGEGSGRPRGEVLFMAGRYIDGLNGGLLQFQVGAPLDEIYSHTRFWLATGEHVEGLSRFGRDRKTGKSVMHLYGPGGEELAAYDYSLSKDSITLDDHLTHAGAFRLDAVFNRREALINNLEPLPTYRVDDWTITHVQPGQLEKLWSFPGQAVGAPTWGVDGWLQVSMDAHCNARVGDSPIEYATCRIEQVADARGSTYTFSVIAGTGQVAGTWKMSPPSVTLESKDYKQYDPTEDLETTRRAISVTLRFTIGTSSLSKTYVNDRCIADCARSGVSDGG